MSDSEEDNVSTPVEPAGTAATDASANSAAAAAKKKKQQEKKEKEKAKKKEEKEKEAKKKTKKTPVRSFVFKISGFFLTQKQILKINQFKILDFKK